MREVTGYLANQFGFSETGRYVLDSLIKPRLREIGIKILEPFEESRKELDLWYVESLELYADRKSYWNRFNRSTGNKNIRLMRESDCLLPILDGGHAIDDGTSGEIGFYAGIDRGPIFALRSDFRCGENIAITINPQLYEFIMMSGGYLAEGQGAMEKWFGKIKEWYDSFAYGRIQ